jgi:hypothetical protein
VAEWSAFLIYTLSYLVAFLIIYAVLLEWFLLRKGFAHLNQYDTERTEGSTSKSAFESLGRAILDVEGRRRSHWLLDNTRSIDLSEPADLLGARVLQGRKLEGPAKGVMNEVKSRLIKERGKVVADALLAKWKADATAHIQQRAAGTEL